MTGLILNGKAVCCMHMGNFDEAETLLLDALTKVKKSVLHLFLFTMIIFKERGIAEALAVIQYI